MYGRCPKKFGISKLAKPLTISTISHSRHLLTLAIETSCDDTSVAILEKHDTPTRSKGTELLFHKKVTADNSRYRGIHPLVALDSHQENLATLLQDAFSSLPAAHNSRGAQLLPYPDQTKSCEMPRRRPDLIAVTRGPGMRSNLSTGIDTAKGLAVALQVPLVGVNHMQAHALTARLSSAVENAYCSPRDPAFPFMSLLVSGGHTLLVQSTSLTDHLILASTCDIAVGDAIDKIARAILPEDILRNSHQISYGCLLENFTFPNGADDYQYSAPRSRKEENSSRPNRWGWALGAPLAKSEAGMKTKSMEFSFSGLESSVKRFFDNKAGITSIEERVELAREAMRLAFEHLASRVVLALETLKAEESSGPALISTLVVAGGVASNRFLRAMLRDYLKTRGFEHIRLLFPPSEFCTDNAAMIGWTGIEMYEAGWENGLDIKALRKWSIDPKGDDGGILGASSWKRRNIDSFDH